MLDNFSLIENEDCYLLDIKHIYLAAAFITKIEDESANIFRIYAAIIMFSKLAYLLEANHP